MSLESCKFYNFIKSGIFGTPISMSISHFDLTLISNCKICYKMRGGVSFPSSNYGVSFELGFAHGLSMHHFNFNF